MQEKNKVSSGISMSFRASSSLTSTLEHLKHCVCRLTCHFPTPFCVFGIFTQMIALSILRIVNASQGSFGKGVLWRGLTWGSTGRKHMVHHITEYSLEDKQIVDDWLSQTLSMSLIYLLWSPFFSEMDLVLLLGFFRHFGRSTGVLWQWAQHCHEPWRWSLCVG